MTIWLKLLAQAKASVFASIEMNLGRVSYKTILSAVPLYRLKITNLSTCMIQRSSKQKKRPFSKRGRYLYNVKSLCSKNCYYCWSLSCYLREILFFVDVEQVLNRTACQVYRSETRNLTKSGYGMLKTLCKMFIHFVMLI